MVQAGDRTPFVSREPERALLRQLLDRMEAGGRALVLISGEPGIGKSRLAQETAAEGASEGVRILTGYCRGGQSSVAYLPFVEILEATARQLPAGTFREALGADAGEMVRLLPALSRSWPHLPSLLDLPLEQERRYFFNSFAEVLDRLSRLAPLMLIIEDLQWADEASLLLLEHLVRRDSQAPLLILATYRDTELDSNSTLAGTLEELHRLRATHRLVLRALDIGATAHMLEALSGQEPPATAVALIYQAGEGNPFFTEELFHHLAEEGTLMDPVGRWRSAPAAAFSVPPAVRLVIERRLARLSAEVQQVLTTAAAIGPSFSFPLLRELVDLEGEAMMRALEEAKRAHIVVSFSAAGESNFRFAHDLIRETLLEGISPPRRQALHLHVADVMERLFAEELPERSPDIANQLLLAGSAADAHRSVRFLLLAGDRALATVAFEDGFRHFDHALTLLRNGDGPDSAYARFRLGLALRGLGKWDRAVNSFGDALNQYMEIGDSAAVGHVCAELALQLFYARRFAECGEIVNRGLAAIGDMVSADRVLLQCIGGRLFSFAGEFERGDELIRRSVTTAEKLGDDRLLGVALLGSTMHHWAWVQPASALERADRAIDLTRGTGALWNLADGAPFVQLALVLAGRLDEVTRLGEEIEPLARRIGHHGGLMVAGRSRLLVEITSGDLAAVEVSASRDLALCEEIGLPWVPDSYAWLGLVSFWRGDWQAALDAFAQGMKSEGPGTVSGACWAGSVLVLAHLGEEVRCRRMLADPPVELPKPRRPSSLGSWTGFLMGTEAVALLGARDEAASRYDLVLEAIAAGNVLRGYDNRLLEAVAGMAAGAAQRWDVAEGHFQRSLELADTLPHRLDQPDVRRLYAVMLMERGGSGDSAHARRLLMEASSLYRKIGMPRHLQMAQALLTDLAPGRSDRVGRPSKSAGLTGREVQVLSLLAGGLTSKEVAEELSLSVTTVQRHIANIYMKIGVRNRAEATAYALRSGLERPTT